MLYVPRFSSSFPDLIPELTASLSFYLLSQYAFFRPLLSLISIICEATGKLCPDEYSIYFAEVYLDAFDFVGPSGHALRFNLLLTPSSSSRNPPPSVLRS